MQDSTVKIQDVKNAFNQAWLNQPITKGKGYKQYKRWEYFMEQRCYPSGERFAPDAVYRAMQEQPQMFQNNANMPGDWTYIGNTSVPSGGGGAGRVNSVRNEPGSTTTFFACAPGGGVWKSINSGASWTMLNTDFLASIGVSDIAINPDNVNEMYIATGDGDAGDTYSLGVLKSTDGGATWNTTGLSWGVSSTRTSNRILIDPNNTQVVIVATSNGIYRTSNGGTSWTQVRTGNFKDLVFHPGTSNTVYACSSQFFKSDDNGVTWTQITSGLPTTGVNRMALAVSADQPDYVYILAGKSSDSGMEGVYRSTNAGVSFTTRYSGPLNLMGWDPSGTDAGGQSWYDLRIEADPNNADIIYTGGVNIWKSSNGGLNWSLNGHWYGGGGAPYVHADIHALYFVPGTTRLLVGCDGGVFTTTDGTNYSDISSNLQIAQQYRLSVSDQSSNYVLTGWQDNGTNLKNGATHTRPIGGDGMECIIDPTNQSVMYGELYYGAIRKSTNTGLSFPTTVCSSGGTGVNEDGAWVTPYVVGSTSGHLYVGKTRVYKSTNGGTSFTALGTMGTGTLNALAVAKSNNNYIYASKGSTLYVSTDGNNFSTVSGLPGLYITYIEVNPTNEQEVYVTFSGFSSGVKVYMSSNAGTTWTNISGSLPNIPANCITYQEGSNGGIYVGTDAGVYYRDNDLGNWVPYMNGLPNVVVSELEIQYLSQIIVAATYGRGTWSAPLYSPAQLDAAIIDVIEPTGTLCTADVAGIIQVLNTGVDDITNLSIQYQVDANPVQTFDWSGLITSGNSEFITLPTLNYGAGSFTYSVEIISVNFVSDDLAGNNTGSSPYNVVIGSNSVTFHLTTDCYGSESSWSLTNDLGVELYNGGGFGDNTTYDTELCLPDGCFTFTFYDSYGDGMSYPAGCATNGDFYMEDNSDNSVIFDLASPAFGFQVSYDFCFNSALPGCTDALACNYNSAAETDDGSCVYGPVNDSCDGAIALVANAAPITGTNVGTCSESANPSCGGSTQIRDVWYSFEYLGGDVIIETSFGSVSGGQPITDTRIAVYESCGGAQVACNDDNDIGLFSTLEFFCGDLTVGQTYLVQVGGFNGLTGGFSIEYLVFDILGCTNPASANYDPCANVDDGSCDVLGCTDPTADNYNSNATLDDGSCIISGCTDPAADNYNALANNDNGSCIFSGCTDPAADNYDPGANQDDGSCIISGCTNPIADNYDASATLDDGSCIISGCTDPAADNYNASANNNDGSCIFSGCTNPAADNYDPGANQDDGSCIISGCTNPIADNYDASATLDDGSCIISGCTNPAADNYNASANNNDGSCIFSGCTNPAADNYDPGANQDDGSCIISGCTNPIADNYNASATLDDGSCIISGCTNPAADNYNSSANNDNGSCIFLGCTDNTACNFDSNANSNDGSCTYAITYYQDFDGDGFGNSGVSTSSCSPVAGYVTNNTDCDDQVSSSYPGATEICGDSVDNNCNTVIDEGCSGNAPVNDNILNAEPLSSVPVYGCFTVDGDLTEATPSGEAQTLCITGEDLWYSFIAATSGARIVVNSSNCNILVELQDELGNLIDEENVQNVVGTEILNFGNLVPGNEYFIGVRNYNSAQGTGLFNICVSHFSESSCNFSTSNLSLCSIIKAQYANTASYNFVFTPISGGDAIEYYSATSTKILLDWVNGLAYNTAYNLQINPVFHVTNGAGSIEDIEVNTSNSCTINFGNPPSVMVRSSDACPNVKGLNQYIMCNPRVCGTSGYEWEVVRTDIPGEPVYTTVMGTLRFLQATANHGFAYGGTFAVRVRPLVDSGLPIDFGPAVCVEIAPQPNGIIANNSDEEYSNLNFDLFPNPANSILNISMSKSISVSSRVEIIDAMGRKLEVFLLPESSSNLIMELPSSWTSGLYFVRITSEDGKVDLIKPFIKE